MLIRVAHETDIVFLKRLLVLLGYPNLSENDLLSKIRSYGQPEYQLLVAESDQEVVGFISLHWFHSFHFAGSIGRISAFCVDDRFRGQGIGIQLLEYAEGV